MHSGNWPDSLQAVYQKGELQSRDAHAMVAIAETKHNALGVYPPPIPLLDMPCSICQHSTNDPNGFMLPGRTHCPAVRCFALRRHGRGATYLCRLTSLAATMLCLPSSGLWCRLPRHACLRARIPSKGRICVHEPGTRRRWQCWK